MITLSARIPRVHRNFKEGNAVRVGVDMGIYQIFNVAFDDSPARLTLPYTAPSLIQFEIDAFNKGFSIRRSKYAMRGGHGRKNKLQPLTKHTDKVQEQRKKIMELVVREAINKILQHVGSRSFIVCLEKLGKLTENRPRCLHKANKNFPYKKLQDMLVRKVEEEGGKVAWVKSAYTSQRCSECGRINTYYNYVFRKDKKNRENGKDPLFRCEECGYGEGKVITGDYNAARNIFTLNIDNLIKKQLKVQGIKKEGEDEDEEDTTATYH
jgi:IS605 OrfB family transposase